MIEFSKKVDKLNYSIYKLLRWQMGEFYIEINKILIIEAKNICSEQLKILLEKTKLDYGLHVKSSYLNAKKMY